MFRVCDAALYSPLNRIFQRLIHFRAPLAISCADERFTKTGGRESLQPVFRSHGWLTIDASS